MLSAATEDVRHPMCDKNGAHTKIPKNRLFCRIKKEQNSRFLGRNCFIKRC